MKIALGLAAIGLSSAVWAASPPVVPEDVEVMTYSSDAFARACRAAGKYAEKDAQHDAVALGCVTYVAGVSHAKAIASQYEVRGQPICTKDVRAGELLGAALDLYEREDFRGLSPAVLIIAAHQKIAPCE